MNTLKSISLTTVSTIVLLGISVAQAAVNVPHPPGLPNGIPTSPIQSNTDVTSLICGSLQWIFWGLIVLAIIMALVAAYQYVTAAGDPEKVSGASKRLLYAAIAVAVALIAQGFPYIVSSFIQGGGGLSNNICNVQ